MLLVDEKTKKAYMSDNVEKQIRVVFPNGEHEDITNDKIEAASFSFTESLCSQEDLKFGLCEANVISFSAECENIKGCVIEVYIDAYHEDEVFTVPYGVFTVTSCKRRAGTHLRKVEAYSESITENDNTLTAFQDWKLQNSIAYAPNVIEYGFEKLKAEICGGNGYEWIDGVTETDGATAYGSGDYVEFDLYEKLADGSYKRKYKVAFYYYRFIEHVVKSNPYFPLLFDFTNPDRVYKCEFEQSEDVYNIIKDLYDKYKCFERYNPSKGDIVEGYVDIYDAFQPHFIMQTFRKPYATPIVAKRRLFRLRNNGVYYPYLPNVGEGDEEQGRLAYFSFPAYVEVTEIKTPLPIVTRYDLDHRTGGYRKNRVKYTEVTETLPTIPIELTREIVDENDVVRYVATEEFFEKTSEFNLVNGYLELQGLFGKSGRSGEWEFFSINDNFALYPQDIIYPNGELYPVLASKNFQPLATVSYKNADYEEYDVHKYGYVRATYLAPDNERYSITIECDPRNDNVYEMRSNYILLNNMLDAEVVKDLIKTNFYPNIKDIVYNPAHLNIKGLPFLEAGDVIKVYADEGTFKTFLFRKTLSGEQSLNDAIDAKGKERHENADKWIASVDVIEKE